MLTDNLGTLHLSQFVLGIFHFRNKIETLKGKNYIKS